MAWFKRDQKIIYLSHFNTMQSFFFFFFLRLNSSDVAATLYRVIQLYAQSKRIQRASCRRVSIFTNTEQNKHAAGWWEMATTIKRAIRDELENLSKIDFDKFCEELLDRREEPRILRRSVEGKGPADITQLLVSTFTEPNALQVAMDTLRQINCNDAAQTLGE